ncbi:hypothetical protein DL768_005529 [Monosporascus sp. mg162]|nr:hypothetical protein DL768_005529 [Monosporascus sp. mg162]
MAMTWQLGQHSTCTCKWLKYDLLGVPDEKRASQMDPITAAAAIITAACAIAGAINSAQQIYVVYRKRRAEKSSGLEPVTPETITPTSAFELSQRMNNLVSRFGRRFESKLDEQVKRQFLLLQPRLKTLVTELNELKNEVSSGHTTEDIDKRWRKLSDQANCLKEEVEGVLTQFTHRIGPSTELHEAPDILPGRPLKFCYGAILCQSGEADARKLSVSGVNDSPQRWGFICTYCFLEVADYAAVRFSNRGEPVVYSDMLAASHVIACASFKDRRAYYKCLACYENHKDLDFPSASTFERHMQNHPDYSFIKNERGVSEETRKKIEYYVLEPKPEVLSVNEDGGNADGNFEKSTSGEKVKDSNISRISSSPDISARDLVEKPVEAAAHGQSLHVNTNNTPDPSSSQTTASSQRPYQPHGYDGHSIQEAPYSSQFTAGQALPAGDPFLPHGISSSAPPSIQPSYDDRPPSRGSMVSQAPQRSLPQGLPNQPFPNPPTDAHHRQLGSPLASRTSYAPESSYGRDSKKKRHFFSRGSGGVE